MTPRNNLRTGPMLGRLWVCLLAAEWGAGLLLHVVRLESPVAWLGTALLAAALLVPVTLCLRPALRQVELSAAQGRSLVEELRQAQTALALANGELEAKVRQRTQEMEQQAALFEVSKAVTSTLHLDRVLQEVVTHTRHLMAADGCALLLRNLDRLELRASSGLDEDVHPHLLPMNAFSSGLTQFGRPHILRGEQLSDTVREALDRQDFNVMVAAPLSSRGNAVGILSIYYKEAQDGDLDPILNLLTTVGSQAAVAIENARLYEQQQHVTRLLLGALAPRPSLGFPGVVVGHRFQPCMELSGDYYDLIPRGPRRFDIVIADVAGKGPDAAILTARAKHIIQAHATAGLGPARVLELLNRQMVDSSDELHLVTVFYAQADLDRGELVYSSAGHEPPLCWNDERPAPQLLESAGILIGVTREATYNDYRVPLREGTSLLLYTDGVTEARSPEGDFFQLQGLQDVLAEYPASAPQDLVNRIYAAVQRFSEGQIGDDLSLLSIRVGLPVPAWEQAPVTPAESHTVHHRR